MVLKLYRGHDPGTILIIILTGCLVWLQPIIDPIKVSSFFNSYPMPLYSLLTDLMEELPVVGTLFSFAITIIIGFYLVGFNTRVFFINERTFLPASLFILLSGFFKPLQTLNPVYPATLLVIIAIDRIVGSYRKQGVAYNFFDASLMIGMASLIYFNSIWLFLGVLAGIALLRTFNLRELILSIAGLITPYIIMVVWYYLAGRDINMLIETIGANISEPAPNYYWSSEMIILSSVVGLTSLVALIHLLSVFNTKKVRSRKTFSLLIWILIIAFLTYIIVPSVSGEAFHILLIPVSYFLTHYLVFKRNKKIANVIFAILFIVVVIVQLS